MIAKLGDPVNYILVFLLSRTSLVFPKQLLHWLLCCTLGVADLFNGFACNRLPYQSWGLASYLAICIHLGSEFPNSIL